jgi:hypothetical protein
MGLINLALKNLRNGASNGKNVAYPIYANKTIGAMLSLR